MCNAGIICKFKNIWDELSIIDGMLFRGDKVVIPTKLQRRILEIGHEGHLGITKTKKFLRANVWFPGMNRDVEDFIGRCLSCQASVNVEKREPLQMTKIPDSAWNRVAVDFFQYRQGVIYW